MKISVKTTLAVLTAMIPTVAHAGAGAVMYGCVYLAVAPINTYTVNFTVGGSDTQCMYTTGGNATLAVSSSGVTCAPLGYVESKGGSSDGDDCGALDSIWSLSYSISNTGYTGTTQTQWSHGFLGLGHNSLTLQNASSGTVVCGQGSSLCNTQSIEWTSGTQGPLYIMFQPGFGS